MASLKEAAGSCGFSSVRVVDRGNHCHILTIAANVAAGVRQLGNEAGSSAVVGGVTAKKAAQLTRDLAPSKEDIVWR